MPCSPRQIASELICSMKVRAEAKGLSLALQVQEGVPETITTDPIRLRQILANLIGNALKFTNTGGVRVVMRLDAEGDPSELRIDVCDTGIGLSQEQIAMLFRPFSQVDSSANRRFGGTGLGLAISKRLAKMLGGDIVVQSAPQHGSTFSLTIAAGPVGEAAINSGVVGDVQSSPNNITDAPSLNCRILLVEDGADNQRLIVHILRKAGAHVVVADDGLAAIELALTAKQAGNPFEAILMDIQMPGMDGYQATRVLRGSGYQGPIIALTAHAMAEDRQKCLDCGCDDYVSKPIDRASLLQLIASHVTSRRHIDSAAHD